MKITLILSKMFCTKRIILWALVLVQLVEPVYISDWQPIQAQSVSPIIIPHPLGERPAKVDVQVKVQENGNDIIFPASGSAQRDDDADTTYGGVVYLYNEHHVKLFVPVRDENSYKGVLIYSGGSSFTGPFPVNTLSGDVRIKVWGLCDLPLANFSSPGDSSISTSEYKTISHGLGIYPDFVVVQLLLTNGYISEAGGVTFSSEPDIHQSICGTVFAFNDQDIRLWTMDDYVACARDGWGAEEPAGSSGTLYIQAWVLDSCQKQFSHSFVMNKDDLNALLPITDTVSLDTIYSLNTSLVSVQAKVLDGTNAGFLFHSGGSAMLDNHLDPYGAILYGYTETEVYLWKPDTSNTNGFLVYVGGKWGSGQNNQQVITAEVTVKVSSLDGTPCSGTNECSSTWTSLTSTCIPTDCPVPVDIPNAYKLYDGLTNGSAALYSCMAGYTESSDDVKIYCVEGVWTTTTLFCKVVCDPPPLIANAEVMVENNKAEYHCNPGYFQKDNTASTIECNTGNAWSVTDFECIQVCSPPPVIAFADVMVHNNIALYSCQNGHRPISGSSLINCSKSNWQATTFSCYAPSCGEVPTIQYADVLVHDDVAMYACRYGFVPTAADNNISCVSGTWLHTTFQCLNASTKTGNFVLNQTLEKWIQRKREELLIDKKTTNSYTRTLISVYDPRPTALAIGGSGVAFLIIALCILIIPDLINAWRFIYSRIRKLLKSK